jgi:hypothetical protein
MAVYFTLLDSVRCPGVVDAPTLDSQLANAMPFGNDWSMRVSLAVVPITPVPAFQVATSPKTEVKPVKERIHAQ